MFQHWSWMSSSLMLYSTKCKPLMPTEPPRYPLIVCRACCPLTWVLDAMPCQSFPTLPSSHPLVTNLTCSISSFPRTATTFEANWNYCTSSSMHWSTPFCPATVDAQSSRGRPISAAAFWVLQLPPNTGDPSWIACGFTGHCCPCHLL